MLALPLPLCQKTDAFACGADRNSAPPLMPATTPDAVAVLAAPTRTCGRTSTAAAPSWWRERRWAPQHTSTLAHQHAACSCACACACDEHTNTRAHKHEHEHRHEHDHEHTSTSTHTHTHTHCTPPQSPSGYPVATLPHSYSMGHPHRIALSHPAQSPGGKTLIHLMRCSRPGRRNTSP